MSPWTSPAAVAVESRLFHALAVLRAIFLANALALNLYRFESYQRPGLGLACLGAMTAWTAFATWAYADPRRRTAPLLVADLALALALLLSTPLVKGEGFSASLPGFWVVGALMAWSIHHRLAGGLLAGVLLASVDLAVRPEVGQSDYGNAFLLVIGGPIVGYMCASLQRLATERDAAERAAAAAAERARLARTVHDGVLQVLALVQRRGRELAGGPGGEERAELAELGRLAGEQEAELRRLIRAQDDLVRVPDGSTVDLVAGLSALERDRLVTVSTPGGPVELPAGTAHELLAAVAACLDNVRAHVGENAPAWVLLEALPDRIEVSVRDEGPGIPAGRLAAAAAEGRLGVAASIRGRLEDLGGRAELTSGADGTEWTLTVPREGAA